MALPDDVDGRAAGVGLRHRGRDTGVGSILGDGVDCRADELARHRDLDQHVGAGVLDRLERPDRAAELVAHLRVGHRRRKHRLGQSEAVAGDRDRGAVVQTADRSVGITVEPQCPGGLDTVRRTPLASRRVSSTTGCGVTANPALATTTGAPSASLVTTSNRSAPSASGTKSSEPSATASPDGAGRDISEQLGREYRWAATHSGRRQPARRCPDSCWRWRRGPSLRRSRRPRRTSHRPRRTRSGTSRPTQPASTSTGHSTDRSLASRSPATDLSSA